MTSIEVLKGDIAEVAVDAIVNAANTSLLGGGGVDGAIHRKAGPELALECRMLNGCRTGHAKMTKAYRLPARFVIHAVGPVWQGGGAGEADLLAGCYREAIRLAGKQHLASLAFPAISTGIYGYPKAEAARIAVTTVRRYLPDAPSLTRVVFCCFADETATCYREILTLGRPDPA